MDEIFEFDPVLYSTEENAFLLEHLGEAPTVALRNLPKGINIKAVKPIIERVYGLMELEKHDKTPWVGVEVLKQKVKIWLSQNQKWAADKQRSKRAPRWPSMFSFDGRGRAHLGGPGSDSGRIKTYFGPAGERLPFAVQLIESDEQEWVAPTMGENAADNRLLIDEANHRIECKVKLADGSHCGHVETYKAESRASYRAARARISKHLRKPQAETEAHLEVYTNEFGGNDAG